MREILGTMKPHIAGLSILGGDPTANRNIDMVVEICREFKRVYPEKSLWVWSGFKIDLDLKEEAEKAGRAVYHSHKDGSNPTFYSKELMEYVDVIVDGRWQVEDFDPTLLWAGSTNQRVIDIKKTLEVEEIVLFTDNKTK